MCDTVMGRPDRLQAVGGEVVTDHRGSRRAAFWPWAAPLLICMMTGLGGCAAGTPETGPTASSPFSASHGTSSSESSTPPVSSSSSKGRSSSSSSRAATAHVRKRASWLTRFTGSTYISFCGRDIQVGVGDDRTITVERLESAAICFPDDGGSDTPPVHLTSPSGRKLTVPTARIGDELWWIIGRPGAGQIIGEFGTYHFTISTIARTHGPPPTTLTTDNPGSSTTSPTPSTTGTATPGLAGRLGPPLPPLRVTRSGQLKVIPATSPHIFVTNETRARGTPVRALLAGLRPGSLVYPSLYRKAAPGAEPPDHVYSFAVDLDAVPINAYGEAVVSWLPPPDLEPGEYAFWFESQPAISAGHRPSAIFNLAS